MKMRIETTINTFVIRSNQELHGLRSRITGKSISWRRVVSDVQGEFVYELSFREFVAFFKHTPAATASIEFEEDGQVTMLSVEDSDIEFGSKLDWTMNGNAVTAYVSLKSTVRIGWNWFGATEALTTERTMSQFELTSEGLALDLTINTRFFKPTSIDVYVVGTKLSAPLIYSNIAIDAQMNENAEYSGDLRFVMPMADIEQMRADLQKHAMGQTTFEFKFKINIAEYHLTNGTQKFVCDKRLVFENPLMKVSSDREDDFVLGTRVSGVGNLILIPMLLDGGTFESVRQQLFNTKVCDSPTETLLLDQGTELERRNIRLLFKGLLASGRSDVHLLTDNAQVYQWSSIENDKVIYANSLEHLAIYPKVKTLIGMGSRHDAFPMGTQNVLPISIRHHVFLIDNLQMQIEERGLECPKHGLVEFMMANQQTDHLITQVFGVRNKKHLTGLPVYDQLEADNPEMPAHMVGMLGSEEFYTALSALDKQGKLTQIDPQDNLHAYKVIMTDDETLAYKASVLGIPVVYVNDALTSDTVDHYYRLSGPVVRDTESGAFILERVLSEKFDFAPYVLRAKNNLNECHDSLSLERMIKILETK